MRGTIRLLTSLINYPRVLVSVVDEIKTIFKLQKKAHPMLVLSYTVLFVVENGGIPGLPQTWHSILLCTPASLEMIEHRLVGIYSIMTIFESNTLSFLHGHRYGQNNTWAESILTNTEHRPFPDSKGS